MIRAESKELGMSALRLTMDAIRAGVRAAIGEFRAARFAHQPIVQDRVAEVRAKRLAGTPPTFESADGLRQRLDSLS